MAVTGQVSIDQDKVLVDRFLQGDIAAFDEIFTCHKERVFAISLSILGNHEDAEDAVQDTFSLVHRHLTKFDGRARFSTWLYRIAVNSAIQCTRRRKARPKTVELTEAMHVVAESANPVIADPVIQKAMAQMDGKDRALLALFYWQDMTLEEIAEVIACSPNAAKTRLFRARERFKQNYVQLGGEGSV